MNINGLSNTQNPYVTSTPNTAQKTPASLWSQLGQSLNSGNLADAQSAFATLKQNYDQNHSTGASGAPSGPLVTDVKQLSQALQSGNLSDAQSAFAKLSEDAKNQGIYAAGNSQNAVVASAQSGGAVSVLV